MPDELGDSPPRVLLRVADDGRDGRGRGAAEHLKALGLEEEGYSSSSGTRKGEMRGTLFLSPPQEARERGEERRRKKMSLQ